MASAAVDIDPRSITFVLPSIPESLRVARFHVRAALSLQRLDQYAETFIVSDSSPEGPAMRETPADSECGRGLRIVEALSVYWGWQPEDDGKAIFAVLAKEARG